MSAGSIIRDSRRAAGLTQAQLARRLGITQPSVARLEAAGDNVTVATLRRALGAIDLTLEIAAKPMPSSVDETLIVASMGMTPGERLERFEREYAGVREFVSEVRPQIARVA
ncbi:MAG TPA: helix-turn-helix transcriptional regulator [Solirubrobacter sp.]|jgi:HTH-type transcriptional regulator/antitoxin HipB|nr:helix-turn-helix transcriptional regulator [Solirubrobacter sp.]